MHIGFRGDVSDEPEVRAGFIGCGSHAFRNIYPTFQFAPVRLVATCDRRVEKARAFARAFGAERSYADAADMLEAEELDAVFIVVGYDDSGRPLYPGLANQCLEAGCHVWMEKPPAATCAEIDAIEAAAEKAGKRVLVGMKKMFFPANEKAKELAARPGFGSPSLVLLQYPQYVPDAGAFERYLGGENVRAVRWFLDHLCHPASLMIYLLGMPATLHYERSPAGSANAMFTFASGAVAGLALTFGASRNAGMERTTIVGENGHHVVVDNGLRVMYHRNPPYRAGEGYGSAPDYFTGSPDEATGCWEPEFSLGQLYNKGLFLLGYYNEVAEFARAILDDRPLEKGTLEQARQVTRIFEAFAEGPATRIEL